MVGNQFSLNDYYKLVKRTILDFQNPITGLLPPSLFQGQLNENASRHAWVRDNVYAILAVWALSRAYKKKTDFDAEKSKQYELEQSVVKLMRGLLISMMQQSKKVESFKKTQQIHDSLHAKYSYDTGKTVVDDDGWGHLQIDATSLYLLTLAQMTTSGLQLVFTKDEVDFIQNLVFYIETAYRIPDFGIWERGDKTNMGLPELNSSSIGMAKAALEAMNELDVFGSRGGPSSVIHVQADSIQYCKAVLYSMLPRESYSKECSASLLSVLSYPAFAIEDSAMIDVTKSEILGKLEGVYGCKRFLRDGHHCMNEDRHRLHYELHELSKFERIECEWPLFFCYLVLDGLYNKNELQVDKYSKLLKNLLVRTEDGCVLLPELFYVPEDKLDAERAHPRSQARLCGNNVPHLWTQSLFIIGQLLRQGFVAVGELDPLNRRYITAPKPELVVQIALISEDEEVKALLAEKGIESQTMEETLPIRILPAKSLIQIYKHLGVNEKLGLSGCPSSSVGIFGIGTLYRSNGHLLAFTPQFLDYRQFYLCLDNELVLDSFKTEIEYLRYNWKQLGRPTLTIPVTHSLLENSLDSTAGKFLLQVASGYLYSARIRIGKLSDLLFRSSVKNIDFIDLDVLEDLISFAPDPTRSPRPGDILLSRDSNEQRPKGRRLSVHGSVSRSRSISRAASWGASSSDDEKPIVDLVRGFVLDRLNSNYDDATQNEQLDEENELDLDAMREQLEKSTDIFEQADILQVLYKARGYNFDIELNGMQGWTVEKLLRDLYEKACHLKSWSLIRHVSGMLRKQVEYLGPNCTELLVHQKQIGVGLPHLHREEIIEQPLPPRAIKRLIYSSCGHDRSSAVLTQELLTYLAMFVKTQPDLFDGMLQIRVGLIMEVMAAEYARTTGLSGEEAADHLMNLAPFQMKSLLYYILSGKEFGVRHESGKSIVIEAGDSIDSGLPMFRTAVKRISKILKLNKAEGADGEISHPQKIGQWLRRRCLDGALNRVPSNFYVKVWHVLRRCKALSVSKYQFLLEHHLTQENTSCEMKFALRVEKELNKIVYPEYRQLVVEVLMVLHVFLERDEKIVVNGHLLLDDFVSQSHEIFLQEQREGTGDATLCCAAANPDVVSPCNASNGICRYFYDSAPSGTYGTMTYFSKVILRYFYKAFTNSNEIFHEIVST